VNKDQLLRLYDRDYAASYEEKFLTSELAKADAEHELRLLAGWLTPGSRWLDVACGTGFFLRHFPEIERAGLDLSPAMLDLARQTNSGVQFHNRSYLDHIPEWENEWDLVSCMWYAYGLVSSMAEIDALVANLAAWTSPVGRCFVPLADPRLISGVDLPHTLESPWPGETSVAGIIWTYAEQEHDKVHRYQIAPHVEHMQALFARHFETVELETYPPALPGWAGRRRALVATRKRQ